jgi:hypothetical protein
MDEEGKNESKGKIMDEEGRKIVDDRVKKSVKKVDKKVDKKKVAKKKKVVKRS